MIQKHYLKKKALDKWTDAGEAIILEYSKKPSVGFRPPAGIRIHKLRLIMKQEKP